MPRVVLAMSGGVDSSVAAHLLQEQGYDVVGVFMRHGAEPAAPAPAAPVPAACATEGQGRESGTLPIVQQQGHKQGCCSAADADDARRVAERLDIPFYALNLEDQFQAIIDYFVDEYTSGRTPNPCIVCNHWVKFGKLFDYADSVDAQFVATGHYARLAPLDGAASPGLFRGVDTTKDQSYVLFGVERSLLDRMLLPVGGYTKADIRRRAVALGLDVAAKRDSQEICFVASGQHDQFVRQRSARAAVGGQIVTTAGRLVGEHEGIERFTVGQRKGLGVALGEPYFVVRIDASSRQVVIGRREELARRDLTAAGVNWLIDPPRGAFRCQAMVRYNGRAVAARAEPLAEGRLRVAFDEPLVAAPGQAVVLYDHDQLLGGAWIEP